MCVYCVPYMNVIPQICKEKIKNNIIFLDYLFKNKMHFIFNYHIHITISGLYNNICYEFD